jgi:UDP-glucose 4-epimerase
MIKNMENTNNQMFVIEFNGKIIVKESIEIPQSLFDKKGEVMLIISKDRKTKFIDKENKNEISIYLQG